jgi:Tol biopolymer transport system component
MSTVPFVRRPLVLLVAGLCAVAAVATLLGRLANGPQAQAKRANLPDTEGAVAYPAFSPDGQRLAYCERAASGTTFHVFVRRLPSGAPQQLTNGSGSEISPAWSPDGSRIAFVRMHSGPSQTADGASSQSGSGPGELIVMPAAGGVERKITSFIPGESPQPQPMLAWTRDSKWLVTVTGGPNEAPGIAKFAVDHPEMRRITAPPEASEGDWSPSISLDGTKLAFTRAGAGDGADLYICDLDGGGLRRLTFDDHVVRGLAWMPDGRELIYAANRSDGMRLFRIAENGGNTHEIFVAGNKARYPAVAPQGNRLAYVDSPSVSSIWRGSLDPSQPGEQPVLRSAGRESAAAYSPDGKRIADLSDQTGDWEIWLSDADGTNRRQLTNLKGPQPGRPQWSPDGRWLLFDVRENGSQRIYKIAAAPGAKPVLLLSSGTSPSWSHDGKIIYFQQGPRLWKVNADGGSPALITQRFGASPVESPDGKFVYFRSRRSIWRMAVGGEKLEEILLPDHPVLSQQIIPSRQGLYYPVFDRIDRVQTVMFYDFATKRESTVYRMRGADFGPWSNFSLSPDGKFILYSKADQGQTNLVVVENFK